MRVPQACANASRTVLFVLSNSVRNCVQLWKNRQRTRRPTPRRQVSVQPGRTALRVSRRPNRQLVWSGLQVLSEPLAAPSSRPPSAHRHQPRSPCRCRHHLRRHRLLLAAQLVAGSSPPLSPQNHRPAGHLSFHSSSQLHVLEAPLHPSRRDQTLLLLPPPPLMPSSTPHHVPIRSRDQSRQ